MLEQVETIVQQLPADQQQVFRDTMAGKSAGDIADALGRSKTAVFVLLFRARRALWHALQSSGLLAGAGAEPATRARRRP